MRVARLVLLGIFTFLSVGIGGESSATGATAQTPTGQDIVHQVQRGDNLHLIAGYYYGDARQWEKIWRMNRAEVRNPNRIEPGTLLRVPDAATPAEPYADFLARVRRPTGLSQTTGGSATAPAGPAPVAEPAPGSPPAAAAPSVGAPAASPAPAPRP